LFPNVTNFSRAAEGSADKIIQRVARRICYIRTNKKGRARTSTSNGDVCDVFVRCESLFRHCAKHIVDTR
jgi:hypothetical protein